MNFLISMTIIISMFAQTLIDICLLSLMNAAKLPRSPIIRFQGSGHSSLPCTVQQLTNQINSIIARFMKQIRGTKKK